MTALGCIWLELVPSKATLAFTIHEKHYGCSFAYSPEQQQNTALRRSPRRLCVWMICCAACRPELIKIDAEGFDLDVIKGGEQAISSAEVVLVEAIVLAKRPPGPNTLLAVTTEMDRQGFCPFDITDLNRTAGSQALWTRNCLCEARWL
jgi:hypothetical protein